MQYGSQCSPRSDALVEIKQMVLKKINEYNKSHGPDGRYTSGSESGEQLSFTKLIDEKYADDTAKKYVDSLDIGSFRNKINLYSDQGGNQIDIKRNKFLESEGIDKALIKDLKQRADMKDGQDWFNTMTPHDTQLANLAHGKPVDANFTEKMSTVEARWHNGSYPHIKDYLDKYPDAPNAVLLMEKFNQHVMRKQTGKDEIVAYRGISGKQAVEMRAGGNNTVGVHTLSSWTTDTNIAEFWSKKDPNGIMLATKIPMSSVAASYMTHTWMNRDREDEIVLLNPSGKMKVARYNIDDEYKPGFLAKLGN